MPQQPVEVFRSARRRACDERAFMLAAVGIDAHVDQAPDGYYVVLVDQVVRDHALHHLWQYEHERRQRPPAEPEFVAKPWPWRGSLVYVAVLLLVPIALAQGWFPLDPYVAGAMDPVRIRAGEWWRAFTALTLHWDAAHLVGNLGGGALLGFSAAQVLGSARAWLLIVLAAALANLVEGTFGRAGYVSAGASTAVFAALGVVAAHAWRTRGQQAHSGMRRWAPLIAGVALLGLFGAGAPQPPPQPWMPAPLENTGSTNVLSHALGFASGVLFGALAATRRIARALDGLPDWLAVLFVIGPVVLAWTLALWPAV